MQRTHAVEVVEDLVHPHDLVVELVVAVGGGQEGVAVRDEHVEEVHHLRVKDNQEEIPFQEGREGTQTNGSSRPLEATGSSVVRARARVCVSPAGPGERCCAWPAAWSRWTAGT